MARPSNFTDRQKAELFVRDRATCAYTGRNLWLLHHGCDPYFQVDWADHLVPVSKGGLSTLQNGVCASWASNFEKGSRTETRSCLFVGGAPTRAFRRSGRRLPATVERQFRTFARLHSSDWYFNRALFRLWLGVAFLADSPCTRARDDAYYAKASFTILQRWKRLATIDRVPPLEQRGLAPKRSTPEQRLMLATREARSARDIRDLMDKLLPYFIARL